MIGELAGIIFDYYVDTLYQALASWCADGYSSLFMTHMPRSHLTIFYLSWYVHFSRDNISTDNREKPELFRFAESKFCLCPSAEITINLPQKQ
jgi:hypothetical protein